jgi:hypothetical protein
MFDFGPPVRRCINDNCHGKRGASYELNDRREYKAILLTREYGPIPILTHSLYCHGMGFLLAYDRLE